MNTALKSAADVTGGEWVAALDADRLGRVIERVSAAEVQVEWTRTSTRCLAPVREIEPVDNIRIVSGGAA